MTELEAVNMMLRKIGSGAVNSLLVGHPDVSNARTTLERTSRRLQKKGWWFNTEYNVTFQPDISTNEITIADTITTLIITDTAITRRGSKLYNCVTNTYTFDAPVTAHRLVRILEWDYLPESMQEAVAYTAAAEFIMDELEDPAKKKDAEMEATRAVIAANKEDLESKQVNRFHNQRILRARVGVRPYGVRLNGFYGDPDA